MEASGRFALKVIDFFPWSPTGKCEIFLWHTIFYPSANFAQGYCHDLCLSVHLSVRPSTLWEVYVSIKLCTHIIYSCTNGLLMRRGFYSMLNFWVSIEFLEKKLHFSHFEKKLGVNEICKSSLVYIL